MAFACYVARVFEDSGREPDLHIHGSVVEVRNCSGLDDGTTGWPRRIWTWRFCSILAAEGPSRSRVEP